MARILIQSATIISMDDRIGDVWAGDVLVENGRIAPEVSGPAGTIGLAGTPGEPAHRGRSG